MKPNFELSAKDEVFVRKIAKRASLLCPDFDVISVAMDVTVTHNNVCRLKLKELLEADNFNFMHDIAGIARHLDRDNLTLSRGFWPRFADK